MTGMSPASDSDTLPPLGIDFDGVPTPTNTLVESILDLLRQSLRYFCKLALWLCAGRAAFKQQVAAQARCLPVQLPAGPGGCLS